MTGFVDRLAARAMGAAGGLRAVARSRFDVDESAVLVETTEETQVETSPRVAGPPVFVDVTPPPRSSRPPPPQPAPAHATQVTPDPDPDSRVIRPVVAADDQPPRPHPFGAVPATSASTPTIAPGPRPEREVESHVIERHVVERVVPAETDRPSSAAPVAPAPPAPVGPHPPAAVTAARTVAVPSADQPAPDHPSAPAPAPAPQAAPEPPVVEVTIGRIEVTARPVVPPVRSGAAPQPPSGPRLEEYLAERSRR